MGNGASIFLSADLSKNLSDKSIRTFQEFENECIARNLNAEQIYDLLVNKYEELLDFDSHKRVDPKPEERPETVSSTKSTSQKSKRPQPKASWGSANAHAKKKLEKRSEVNTYYSKLSQKSKPKLQSSDSNRSLSTLRGSMDGTELNTISEELYGLNRADSHEFGDDETVCMTAIEAISCELTTCSAKTDISTTQNLLLPSEEYECKLCRKSFNSRHRLDRHLRFSEIHRQTLISLKERFFDDANGLDNLAKKAITHFQDSFKASFSYLDGDLNLNRLRWKKAIGKVVSRFIARKYETFVSQLHHSQLHPPLLDDKINLLHTDHKFFWRSKSRFLFHFYFHEMYDCIEIIPQLLPSTGMLSLDQQQNLNMEGNSISNRSDSVDSSMNFTSATYNDVKLDPTKISPRFYINRRTIQKILLQQKEHSLSEEEEEAEAAAKRTENTNNPEAITIPPPTITDMEICKFLLSKLKIDNLLLENKLTIEKAIYFDSNHMMKNIQQLITINTVIPHGLKAMNIEGLKLYDGWEIQTKLQEIQSTHEELNRAVDKADQFSKSVKLFSPSNLLARFSPYLSPKKRFNANKFNLVVSPTAGTAK